jgi:hypothetical protein
MLHVLSCQFFIHCFQFFSCMFFHAACFQFSFVCSCGVSPTLFGWCLFYFFAAVAFMWIYVYVHFG